MSVVDIEDVPLGQIVGFTQAYCLYRLAEDDALCVSRWQDVALAGVCPADPLLPDDVAENDRLNATASTLRELELLGRLGELTSAQSAARRELIDQLCGE